MKMIPGLKLPSALQRQALAFYVHRYTRDHTPSWVAACPRLDGGAPRRIPPASPPRHGPMNKEIEQLQSQLTKESESHLAC